MTDAAELKAACERILADAENFDIDLGNERANMLRQALGLPKVIYSEFYQALLNHKGPLLGPQSCSCSEKHAAVCESMPEHQPEYCRVGN